MESDSEEEALEAPKQLAPRRVVSKEQSAPTPAEDAQVLDAAEVSSPSNEDLRKRYAEKESAEKERAEKERAEKESADKERADKERAGRSKATAGSGGAQRFHNARQRLSNAGVSTLDVPIVADLVVCRSRTAKPHGKFRLAYLDFNDSYTCLQTLNIHCDLKAPQVV